MIFVDHFFADELIVFLNENKIEWIISKMKEFFSHSPSSWRFMPSGFCLSSDCNLAVRSCRWASASRRRASTVWSRASDSRHLASISWLRASFANISAALSTTARISPINEVASASMRLQWGKCEVANVHRTSEFIVRTRNEVMSVRYKTSVPQQIQVAAIHHETWPRFLCHYFCFSSSSQPRKWTKPLLKTIESGSNF